MSGVIANGRSTQLVIEANSSGDALRVTQQGLGNAIIVEDSANPDATPFVVTKDGNVGAGTNAPASFGANYTTVHVSNTQGGVFRTSGGSAVGDFYADSAAGGFVILRTVGSFPLRLDTNSTERVRIDANGNVVVSLAALATTATNGFLYIPTCAGAPTGVPTAYTGRAAIVYDTTNNRLCVYNGGWKTVTLA